MDTIVLILVVSLCVTVMFVIGALLYAMGKMAGTMNEVNERHTNHLAALTSTFAEGCMAISEANRDVIMKRLDADAPTPVHSRQHVPPPQEVADITANVETWPPPLGGDPSR